LSPSVLLPSHNATVTGQGALDALYKNHTSLRHARQAVDNQGHHWQNLALAFSSVSQTTADDEKSPHEFIHLAVAMQFSGFRSVISSMRSFDDKVARQVVSAFTATWSIVQGDWAATMLLLSHYALMQHVTVSLITITPLEMNIQVTSPIPRLSVL
jgi:hypothetical protein